MTSQLSHADRRIVAKRRLLQMHYESGVGHLGGNLSALDILLSLHHDILGTEDQFVLSKGHAAGALYVALWSIGRISDDQLKQFHRDGTLLSGHPPARGLCDILFGTGSLGHGLGLCCGLALAKQLRGADGQVYCLTSDGEWNEGSCWESLIFAVQKRLGNLVVIVDKNGLQGFGRTSEVANLEPMAARFQSFGASTVDVAGHDQEALTKVLRERRCDVPTVIIADTVKGHGVSFMSDRLEWHYLPMTEIQYRQAIEELPNV